MFRPSSSDFSAARQALLRYTTPLEAALKAVVSTSLDAYANQVLTPGIRPIHVNRNQPTLLRRNPDLSFEGHQFFRLTTIDDRFHIQVIEYIYEITTTQMGSPRRVVAFHWHPLSETSPYRDPHLHIGTGAGQFGFDLTNAHVPSGRVLLEDVLELAIDHFQVQPAQRHWRRAFDRSRRHFADHATWGQPPPAL